MAVPCAVGEKVQIQECSKDVVLHRAWVEQSLGCVNPFTGCHYELIDPFGFFYTQLLNLTSNT